MSSEIEIPLAIVSKNGAIIAVNSSFCQISKLTASELLSRNILSLVDHSNLFESTRAFHALQALASSVPLPGAEYRAPATKIVTDSMICSQYELVIKRSMSLFAGAIVLEATFEAITSTISTITSSETSSDVLGTGVIPLPNHHHSSSSSYIYNDYNNNRSNGLIVVDSQTLGACCIDYHSIAAAALHAVNLVQPKRILIVDDACSTLKVMARMISRLGQEVHTATNGREALDMLLQYRYDLVVMDLFMPLMNGMQASSKYRQFEGNPSRSCSNRQKMIAISGEAAEGIENQVDEAGFDGFIRKPLTVETFRKLILSLTDTKIATPADVLNNESNETDDSKDNESDSNDNESEEDESESHSYDDETISTTISFETKNLETKVLIHDTTVDTNKKYANQKDVEHGTKSIKNITNFKRKIKTSQLNENNENKSLISRTFRTKNDLEPPKSKRRIEANV